MGFDDCRYMFNCSHAKKVVEGDDGSVRLVRGEMGDGESYTTDWLTSRALDFIAQDREAPFFLTLAIPDPHDPFSVRAPYDSMFRPEEVVVPSTFGETDLPDWMHQPGVSRWSRPAKVVGNEETLRRARAQYLGEVKCIDDNVGRVMTALESSGLLDETIVVFTTDHGEYMGEHGIYAKNQLYETAYRVPFVVRTPPSVAPGGRTVDSFLTAVDVQQTLLGLLGIPANGTEHGRDGSGLIRGEGAEPSWRDEAYVYGTAFNRVGIFTPDYELAYVMGARDHILFDRRRDPLQTANLFHNPEMRPAVRALTDRLIEHTGTVGAPECEWLEGIADAGGVTHEGGSPRG
jgi:uncharacterized sulfatase